MLAKRHYYTAREKSIVGVVNADRNVGPTIIVCEKSYDDDVESRNQTSEWLIQLTSSQRMSR